MLEEDVRRAMRLHDNVVAFAQILKNSGLPAEEAVAMAKAFACRELPEAAAAELGMRSVLNAYCTS